jgi:F-type H+-transporting ATPase subunit b
MDELRSVFTNPGDAHFWIFIALVVVVAILVRAGVHRMAGKALDDAGAKVQAQLDEAARLRKEAEDLLAEIKAKRTASEQAAVELLKTAQEDAEKLRAEAAEKLEEDIARREAQAERKIALAEAQAAADVRAAAADLAAQAAEAVLTARIKGAANDPSIDAGLAGLSRFKVS